MIDPAGQSAPSWSSGMRIVAAIAIAVSLFACGNASETTSNEDITSVDKELIVLASPPDNDTYYTDVAEEIFDFHIAYAKQIAAHDNVLVLARVEHYDAYVAELSADRVANIEMQDIWMRDFSPQNAASPVMLRYSAAGQGGGRKGQSDADAVQETLAEILEDAGLSFSESDLINDGGNFVDDYAGNVVISNKFLRDNSLTETEGRAAMREITGATNIAFIEADEQGGLEHADGVVAFIDENVLVINAYPEDPAYAADLRASLERGLPGVTIHEIVTPYDGEEIYDAGFGSACGLYTNMLVTPKRIYLPQFGIAEDTEALAAMRNWTDKEIIPVASNKVCHMGGGVRCMSWQLRGENAEKLLAYVSGRS